MNNTVSPDEVVRRVQDDADDLFVLNVRNEGEYAEWRIPGSTNLPVYDELLENDFSTLEANLDELPEDREITVVCVGGVTSSRAAAVLQDHGFDAKSVDGGMNAWGRIHRDYEAAAVEGVVQIVRPGTGGLSYLVHDGEEAVVVDPSQYLDVYFDAAAERGLDITAVADTHAHADHISGAPAIAAEHDVPYYLHDADAGDRSAFVETIVESLADEPANYDEIKQINWGNERPTEDAEALELGPNNCAAN